MTEAVAEVVRPAVSYSALDLHRTCPQAWNYKYVRGLEPDVADPQIDRLMGSWWHAVRGAEAISRGIALDSLRLAPKKLRTCDDGPVFLRNSIESAPRYRVENGKGDEVEMSVDLILDAAEAYWRTLSGDHKEMWAERIGGSLADRLAHLDQRYRARWDDSHEAPLGVEVKFRTPLPGTEAEIKGFVDLIVLDTRRGIVVVRDWKSKRSLDNATTHDDLMDSQLHDYAWGVSPLVREWGHKISAISYDRTRTAPPKQPEVTQSGTLSKSVSDYDLQTYIEWARGPEGEGVPYPGRKKDGSGAGLYVAEQSVIEKLSSPSAASVWHQRTLVPLNRNVVTAHVQAAIDTVRDTERTLAVIEDRGAAPRNFTRWGCKWCDFASLCRAEMMGGPDGEYPLSDHGLKQRDLG